MALGVFSLALTAVAVLRGDNLLLLVVSLLLAAQFVALWAGWRNLRGLTVTCRLPDEVFAGRAVSGAYGVSGPRPAFDVQLIVPGQAQEARTACVPGRSGVTLPVRWMWPRRGRHSLGRVVLRSRYPFGLCHWSRSVPCDAEVLVWPRHGEGAACQGVRDGVQPSPLGMPDEPVDLRDYRVGDRLGDLHWAAAARTGRPMVVVRAGAEDAACWVRVPDLRGEAFERALEDATAAVVQAADAHEAVGLELAGQRFPARHGEAWRRQLLATLALAEPSP